MPTISVEWVVLSDATLMYCVFAIWVNPSVLLAMRVTLCAASVVLNHVALSPNDQFQQSGLFEDVSLNPTASGATPLVTFEVNYAMGAAADNGATNAAKRWRRARVLQMRSSCRAYQGLFPYLVVPDTCSPTIMENPGARKKPGIISRRGLFFF